MLLFILVKFGGPAISKALAARHQQLKAELAAASAARAEAEARLKQQEARLAALEQEIDGIRAGIKAEAEAEKARLIAAAEERAKRIKEETAFVLDQQVKEAEARLRREVAQAAVDLAEQMVRRSRWTRAISSGWSTRSWPTSPRRAGGRRRGKAGLMAAMGGSVARRYARALFGIGVDSGKFEALGQEIGDLAELWSSSAELRQALENPVFRPSEKRAVLEQILPRVAPTPEVQRLALLLLERRRILLLPAIARAYRDLADAHTGRVRAR